MHRFMIHLDDLAGLDMVLARSEAARQPRERPLRSLPRNDRKAADRAAGQGARPGASDEPSARR